MERHQPLVRALGDRTILLRVAIQFVYILVSEMSRILDRRGSVFGGPIFCFFSLCLQRTHPRRNYSHFMSCSSRSLISGPKLDKTEGLHYCEAGEPFCVQRAARGSTPEKGVVPSGPLSLHALLNDAGVARNIMQHVSLSDILRCRCVSRQLLAAANTDCPVLKPGAFFLRFDPATIEGRTYVGCQPDSLRYCCARCGTSDDITLASCHHCGLGRDTNGICRLFIGQIRKVDTALHLAWLLAKIFPDLAVYHIEAQTHTEAGSKGCAWVYLRDDADEARVVNFLQQRVCVGRDEHHGEAVWIVRRETNEIAQPDSFPMPSAFLSESTPRAKKSHAPRKSVVRTPPPYTSLPPPPPYIPIAFYPHQPPAIAQPPVTSEPILAQALQSVQKVPGSVPEGILRSHKPYSFKAVERSIPWVDSAQKMVDTRGSAQQRVSPGKPII